MTWKSRVLSCAVKLHYCKLPLLLLLLKKAAIRFFFSFVLVFFSRVISCQFVCIKTFRQISQTLLKGPICYPFSDVFFFLFVSYFHIFHLNPGLQCCSFAWLVIQKKTKTIQITQKTHCPLFINSITTKTDDLLDLLDVSKRTKSRYPAVWPKSHKPALWSCH